MESTTKNGSISKRLSEAILPFVLDGYRGEGTARYASPMTKMESISLAR